MKKCLQGRIQPSQYLWKILNLHIQVAMSHTGSRKKTWIILLVICIRQNNSPELLASQLKQWNLVQEKCKDHQFQESEQRPCFLFDMENKLCYCTNIPGLFTSPWFATESFRLASFHRLFQAKSQGVFFCTTGINIPAFPLRTLSI